MPTILRDAVTRVLPLKAQQYAIFALRNPWMLTLPPAVRNYAPISGARIGSASIRAALDLCS